MVVDCRLAKCAQETGTVPQTAPSPHTSVRGDTARDRILEAAYFLFVTKGTRSVGVDSIIARSGVAKMTLYRHFRSKHDLINAVLEMRESRWSVDWMQTDIRSRASGGAGRMLAIFDLFDEWFHGEAMEGCFFINVLLEYPSPDDTLHAAAARHLENVRGFLGELAEEAGFDETPALVDTWHILMKGSIISACEGNRGAAKLAKRAARALIAQWPRKISTSRVRPSDRR